MEAKSVFKVLLVTHYEKNENDNNSNRISWRQNSICQTPVLFLTSIQASDVILRKKRIKEAMELIWTTMWLLKEQNMITALHYYPQTYTI